MHIGSLSCLEREAYFTFCTAPSSVLMKSELAEIRLKERKVASLQRKHQMDTWCCRGGCGVMRPGLQSWQSQDWGQGKDHCHWAGPLSQGHEDQVLRGDLPLLLTHQGIWEHWLFSWEDPSRTGFWRWCLCGSSLVWASGLGSRHLLPLKITIDTSGC